MKSNKNNFIGNKRNGCIFSNCGNQNKRRYNSYMETRGTQCRNTKCIWKGKKGQSILLSHAILVGLSVMLVFVIATTMNNLRSEYQDFITEASVDQLCLLLKNGVEKVYRTVDYNSSSNTTYGTLYITFPDRLADKNYRLSFIDVNKTASVESGDNSFNTTCKIGLNASYGGFTTGGRTRIDFVYYTNGTRRIGVAKI